MNFSSRKVQKIVRFHEDQIKKIEAKLLIDHISFQKAVEIMFKLYLKNNREIARAIEKHIEENKSSRRRGTLSETEIDNLHRLLETEYSPLRDVDSALEELKNEEK